MNASDPQELVGRASRPLEPVVIDLMVDQDQLPLFLLGSESGDGISARPGKVERFMRQGDRIAREVARRDGKRVRSSIVAPPGGDEDLRAAHDSAWLRAPRAPRVWTRGETVRIADLFSGCGGITLGVSEACRALGLAPDPVVAIDSDVDALRVYTANFPGAEALSAPIETYLDGEPGEPLTEKEQAFARRIGGIDIVVAGPPCQGNSNLNNHTRYADPKNELYLKVIRFAEVISPDHIVIENVPGIFRDEKSVLLRAYRHLDRLGYGISVVRMFAERLGVAQTRHRVFVLASRKTDVRRLVNTQTIEAMYGTPERTFEWACGDLADASGTFLDQPAVPKPITQDRIDYLFEKGLYELPDLQRPDCHKAGHTYPSVYGRMHADRAAPTITTGFGTMGRGRFVHPERRRVITAHEAARLQFFPDHFDFVADLRKESHKSVIGNAVPSKLGYIAGLELMR